MSGRVVFSESEKLCLQELIIKYKLNTTTTITAANQTAKKTAWARLTMEFNSIESNCKRTEAQLKKCWDNLKTRRKAILSQEKRQRMKTGGGEYHPTPSTSKDTLMDEALAEQTDVELQFVIDSDAVPLPQHIEDISTEMEGHEDQIEVQNTRTRSLTEPAEGGIEVHPARTGSRFTDYSVESLPIQGGKNVRTKVISEEFSLRKENYKKNQEREEELHKLKLVEYEWKVKTAEELYHKARLERESAAELLLCNQARRKEAEILLKNKENTS